MALIDSAEQGFIPDYFIRKGIQHLLRVRIREISKGNLEDQSAREKKHIEQMLSGPIAVHTKAANDQHYEMPPEFMALHLGPRLKYSSCYFKSSNQSLAQAEETMLDLTCKRAEIKDGQNILELGCGWGSLSLWMAEKYPHAQITGVSNSAPQRKFIEGRAQERNLKNLKILTADMNSFSFPEATFDRVVSVEMFEHMRNWQMLLERVSNALKADGKFFFHIFTHRESSYFFETEGDDNWLGKYFFTGGMMPSDALPLYFQKNLEIEEHWKVDGTHYGETAERWLQGLDQNREAALKSLQSLYPNLKAAQIAFQRWRIFYMACAELWNFNGGIEWLVSHYRMKKRT